MSLTNLLVPTYRHGLDALMGWLAKAEKQFPTMQAEALLSARLAPDMYPLSTQVRFVCVQIQEAIFRLNNAPIPNSVIELREEGQNAEQQPGSLAQAQTRVQETIELLEELSDDALDTHLELPIVLELQDGMLFDLTAEQYARDWSLPQFYFHLMTAYAILRKEEVELGKADYVPHMFTYLRPVVQ